MRSLLFELHILIKLTLFLLPHGLVKI